MYIKGIHNMVADAISWLDYGPVKDDILNWMTFDQCWCYHNSTEEHKASTTTIKDSMNIVFVNKNKEDSIYLLTTREIAEAQQEDKHIKNHAGKKGYSTQLVENTKVLCKDGKMVIPTILQHHVVAWFHPTCNTPGPSIWKKLFVFYVLERSTNNSPNTCQKVLKLLGEQMQKTQTWEVASKTCNHHHLGGIMCGPNRTLHPQR